MYSLRIHITPAHKKHPRRGAFSIPIILFLMRIRQHSVGALYAIHGGGHNATGVTGALTAGVHPRRLHWQNSSRKIRTLLEERVSGAVSTASGRAKPWSRLSISVMAACMVVRTLSGRQYRRLVSVTPVGQVGCTLPSARLSRSAKKSPTSCAGAR